MAFVNNPTGVISKSKSICFITGASRGLGKALAIGFAKVLGKDSTLVLIARNHESLDIVKQAILVSRSDLRINVIKRDLAKISKEEANEIISMGIGTNDKNTFDQVILINNVGSLGDISKTVDKLDCFEKSQEYYNLNVHSVTVLTSVILQVFPNLITKLNKCLLINISSLAAIQPFHGWSEYCSAKAARDMYFKVTSLEFPNVSVINYAPGPLETDMTEDILMHALPEVKNWFVNARLQKTLVNCDDSVSKLISVLNSVNFKSGDHLDFFDA